MFSHRRRGRLAVVLTTLAFGAMGCSLSLGGTAPEPDDAAMRDVQLDAGFADAASGDAGDGDAAADGSAPAAVRPVFDPAVLPGGSGTDRFFDFPFPSGLRTDAEGHPVLDDFPVSAGGPVQTATEIVERERIGFSPVGAAYFRFTGALDPASLPADAAASLEPSSSVWLLDIDPSSPEHGQRLPALVTFQQESTTYWSSHTLAVRALPGMQMRPDTRYAVVVRDTVESANGLPVEGDPTFEALKQGMGDAALRDFYGDVWGELEAAGLSRDEILVATAFETSNPARELDTLRETVHAGEPAVASGWSLRNSTADYETYTATFETTVFFSGEPPYDSFIGEGAFRFDDSGQPLDMAAQAVRLAVTVPTTPMPADGYPVVLYGHGSGGDHLTHTDDVGPALAQEGVATLGFEAALHGQRVSEPVDVATLTATNPVAGRELVRQTTVDIMVVLRMLAEGGAQIPASAGGGAAIEFDPEPVLYMGHSQGSQEAGLLLGVEPTIDSAFLSEGGGGSLIPIFEREFNGQPIICVVSLALQARCEQVSENHPALTLLVQPLLDPADPLTFTGRFLREPVGDGEPPDIVMTEGTMDSFTPPRSIEAMASAIGLPIVEPVVQTTSPYALSGPPTAAAPVQGNIAVSGGDSVTGGLLQFEGAGHFVVFRDATARNQYVEFLSTAAAGNARLPAR